MYATPRCIAFIDGEPVLCCLRSPAVACRRIPGAAKLGPLRCLHVLRFFHQYCLLLSLNVTNREVGPKLCNKSQKMSVVSNRKNCRVLRCGVHQRHAPLGGAHVCDEREGILFLLLLLLFLLLLSKLRLLYAANTSEEVGRRMH